MSTMPAFTIHHRVYFEDTDALGIVYHANYLRFMERARSEWLWSLGLCFNTLMEQDIAFVVHHIAIDYKKPAKLKDQLLCSCKVISYRKSSLTFEQQVMNANHHDFIYCSAQVRVVCTTLSGTVQPIPAVLLEKLT